MDGEFINTNMSVTPPRPVRNSEFRTPEGIRKVLFPRHPGSNLRMKAHLIERLEPTLNSETPKAEIEPKKDYLPEFGPE